MTPEERKLHRQLHDLPDLAVPAALEARILRTRRGHLRRRGTILGVACLACGALAVATLPQRSPVPAAPAPHAAAMATEPEAGVDVDLQLRAIDQALQAAYDSNARSDEIASLWKARKRLAGSGSQPSGTI